MGFNNITVKREEYSWICKSIEDCYKWLERNAPCCSPEGLMREALIEQRKNDNL
jgi:hypothetical protein